MTTKEQIIQSLKNPQEIAAQFGWDDADYIAAVAEKGDEDYSIADSAMDYLREEVSLKDLRKLVCDGPGSV